MERKKITVFGSFVVDLMGRGPHLPVPGETVKGSLFRMGPGGKGFNQGVAAHKAGANVTMITKLGRDSFAEVALSTMRDLHMDSSHVFIADDVETGCALIMVDEITSQNEIMVLLGACGQITAADVRSVEGVLKDSAYLLTQLETNVDAMEMAVNCVHAHGVQVILNTAPVQPVTDELLAKVDIITPNEVEAEILTGIPVHTEDNARQAALWFMERGVRQVIITLGGRGAFVHDGTRSAILPVPRVQVVDTTGAGDAFNGGLVAGLAEGRDLWDAARFANALAALSVQKLGTTPSMPTRADIDAFMSAYSL